MDNDDGSWNVLLDDGSDIDVPVSRLTPVSNAEAALEANRLSLPPEMELAAGAAGVGAALPAAATFAVGDRRAPL